MDLDIVIREDGTRHVGCDESSGWIWRAARTLEEVLLTGNEQLKGLRILELGSGTGWLALRLAARGAHVTATERPGAIPLLLRNVLGNQERFLEKRNVELQVNVECLDWEEEDRRIAGTWDLMIGSDILYLSEYYLPLLQTLLRHDCQRCILCWEQRKPAEEERFIQLALQLGFTMDNGVAQKVGVNEATNNPILLLSMVYRRPDSCKAEEFTAETASEPVSCEPDLI